MIVRDRPAAVNQPTGLNPALCGGGPGQRRQKVPRPRDPIGWTIADAASQERRIASAGRCSRHFLARKGKRGGDMRKVVGVMVVRGAGGRRRRRGRSRWQPRRTQGSARVGRWIASTILTAANDSARSRRHSSGGTSACSASMMRTSSADTRRLSRPDGRWRSSWGPRSRCSWAITGTRACILAGSGNGHKNFDAKKAGGILGAEARAASRIIAVDRTAGRTAAGGHAGAGIDDSPWIGCARAVRPEADGRTCKPDGRASRLSGEQRQRVGEAPVHPHLVVQMRTGRTAGRPTKPIKSPRFTCCPSETTMRERWPYLVMMPYP